MSDTEWGKAPVAFAKVESCMVCNRGTPPGQQKLGGDGLALTGSPTEAQVQAGGKGRSNNEPIIT